MTVDLNVNKAVVRRFYERAVNQQNLNAVEDLLTPDFVHNGEQRGSAGQRQVVAGMLAAFPDLHVTVDAIIAEGDDVAARCTWSGTQHGVFLGVAPTSRVVTFQAIALLRLVDGRIAQAWENEDDLGLLRQLGATPSDRS